MPLKFFYNDSHLDRALNVGTAELTPEQRQKYDALEATLTIKRAQRQAIPTTPSSALSQAWTHAILQLERQQRMLLLEDCLPSPDGSRWEQVLVSSHTLDDIAQDLTDWVPQAILTAWAHLEQLNVFETLSVRSTPDPRSHAILLGTLGDRTWALAAWSDTTLHSLKDIEDVYILKSWVQTGLIALLGALGFIGGIFLEHYGEPTGLYGLLLGIGLIGWVASLFTTETLAECLVSHHDPRFAHWWE